MADTITQKEIRDGEVYVVTYTESSAVKEMVTSTCATHIATALAEYLDEATRNAVAATIAATLKAEGLLNDS